LRRLNDAIDLALVYTIALIELKTAKAEQKLGQLALQLVSLALVSRAKQGVVVLGTDRKNKWMLLHFSGFNKIIVQPLRAREKVSCRIQEFDNGWCSQNGNEYCPTKTALHL
jgi:hypothetical protein